MRISDFILKHKNKLYQLIKFSFFGAFGYLFSVALIFCLKEFLQVHYLVAWFLAWIFTNLITFFFNNKYTFKNNKKIIPTLIKYYTVNLSSFLITLALMYVSVELLKIYYLTATIGISLVLLGYNFIIHRNWSFK
jgi:putative flippase GtrA